MRHPAKLSNILALYICGKTINQLLLEDISAEIEKEYRPSEENDEFLDSNAVSMSIQTFYIRNHLIDEISKNLQLDLKPS